VCLPGALYRGDHDVINVLMHIIRYTMVRVKTRDETRRDETRRDETRRDETRLYKTIQDKIIEDETRHEKREGERTRIEPLVVPYLGIDP